VLYDTVDLHWLREARRQKPAPVVSTDLDGPERPPTPLSGKAGALRELELAMIRASDATIVVSERERSQVEADVPGARVLVVPNLHEVQPNVPPPGHRSGVLFIGSFEHAPNVDAAVQLVRDVMPAVWSELGPVRVMIAGARPPSEVRALAAPLVDVAGWVEDLQPLLRGSLMMVAPLRYGAGMKGKVTQCLAAGLPVVTTSIGAEGLCAAGADERGIEADASCVLVANDPREMAYEVVRLHREEDLWWRLSRTGQDLVRSLCSAEVVTQRLASVLDLSDGGSRSVVGAAAKP
jgi:glycosyltransferase involved in cell wall biosynthesis